MRVLFILENYPPHYGGVEVVFESACEGLARRGYDVTLVTHQLKDSKRHEVRNGVKIVRVPCLQSRYLFTFLAPLYAYAHAKEAEVIHTTTFNAAPAAWLVARLSRKPVVVTVHETWRKKWAEFTDMPRWKIWLHEFLEWLVFLPTYDKYACVSQSTARQLATVMGKKVGSRIVVNHNGFDYAHWRREVHLFAAQSLRKKLGLENKFVVFGYGRPGVSKGFSYLVESFPLFKQQIKNAHLVLMLSNNKAYEKEHRKITGMLEDQKKRQKSDQESVTVLGPVAYRELAPYVAMANCVVVPSLSEGFGYTTVEANAIGTPLVASNTTSIPEVISGKHVLVQPRNPQAIANGVVQVFRKKYKDTPLKKFLWKDNLNRVEKIYQELVQNTRRSPARAAQSPTQQASPPRSARKRLSFPASQKPRVFEEGQPPSRLAGIGTEHSPDGRRRARKAHE